MLDIRGDARETLGVERSAAVIPSCVEFEERATTASIGFELNASTNEAISECPPELALERKEPALEMPDR